MVNQWAVAVGAQLTQGKIKYRVGYSWNSNPLNQNVGNNLDGFPVLQQNVQLFQAANVPLVNQNRITGGIGRADVLIKGLDFDAFAGGLFKATGDFGPHTEASLAMYYVGLGLTWRFDGAVDHHEE
jgi:long-chain fatty acid transport protein